MSWVACLPNGLRYRQIRNNIQKTSKINVDDKAQVSDFLKWPNTQHA